MAYSLLGIFDIHMPLIYGEGAKQAFQRLQLEIIKSTPDLSIFAWHVEQAQPGEQFCSLLAQSPSQFGFTRRVGRSISERHYTMTNKGLEMTTILHQVHNSGRDRYFLCLENRGDAGKSTGILLRKIDYNVFMRVERSLAEIVALKTFPSTHTLTFYIITSPQQHIPIEFSSYHGEIHVPPTLQVLDTVPQASWDCESRVLLGNMPCHDGVRALKLQVVVNDIFEIIVVLVRSSNTAIAFDANTDTAISSMIFTRSYRRGLMDWGELLNKIPELGRFHDRFMIWPTSLKVEITPRARHSYQLNLQLKALNDQSLSSIFHNVSVSMSTSQDTVQAFAPLSGASGRPNGGHHTNYLNLRSNDPTCSKRKRNVEDG
jgi:hypothetical protein